MGGGSFIPAVCEATPAATVAERESALRLLDRVVKPEKERRPGQAMTLGADTQYQEETFIAVLRERGVAPHVSEYRQGNRGKNCLTEAERIEKVFGWGKLEHGRRQGKRRGRKRVDWFYRLALAGYNLVRMRKRIAIPALAA